MGNKNLILILLLCLSSKCDYIIDIFGDWGLGIGDWGLGIGPNPPIPRCPIPNPQSPIPIIINPKSFSFNF